MSARAQVLAELFQPVEAQTPYGGRVVSYVALGVIWLTPGTLRQTQRTEAGVSRIVRAQVVVVRIDPRIVEGLTLRFQGADWVVTGLQSDADRPGRCEISLEVGR